MPPPDPDLPPFVAGSTAAGRPALLADLEQFDDTVTAEIINGRLIVSPRPAPPHIRGASILGALLTNPFDLGLGGPGGWVILDEPELHLGWNEMTQEPHVAIPDLAGWRRERLPERPKTPFYEVVPDWVAEFLSPSTGADGRIEKLPFYAREGVKWAWLLDPLQRTLEAYELVGGRWTLAATHRGNAKVRVAPFDAIELDLRLVWEH